MIARFTEFLGAGRLRALFILIAVTGLLSLILNAVNPDDQGVRAVQSGLAVVAVVGTAIIVGTAIDREDRARWVALLVPAGGAILLGMIFLPQYLPVLVGGAIGWVIAGLLLFRSRAPMQYREAVKLFRRGELGDAVKVMDRLIKDEPMEANHYRFRAELLRVQGKLERAKRDYQKMTELLPRSPIAYNGLSEVLLQAGDHASALAAAEKASEYAPGDWVALYNLGMIEDRLQRSSDAIAHLQRALTLKVPDGRHRLLIHLYLARAYARLGDDTQAQTHADALQRDQAGLNEWRKILADDKAATLRAVIGADIETIENLLSGNDIASLAGVGTVTL